MKWINLSPSPSLDSSSKASCWKAQNYYVIAKRLPEKVLDADLSSITLSTTSSDLTILRLQQWSRQSPYLWVQPILYPYIPRLIAPAVICNILEETQ